MQSFFYLKGRLYLVCISAVSRPDPEKRIHMTFVGHVGELERANQTIFCCCVLIAIGFVARIWFAIVRTRPRITARDWLCIWKKSHLSCISLKADVLWYIIFILKRRLLNVYKNVFLEKKKRLCQTRHTLEMEATERGKQVFYDLFQWSDDMFWLVPFLFCFGRWGGLAALQEGNGRLEVAGAATTTNVERGMIMVVWD